MCYVITCSRCEKKTWAGCGQHAKRVMETVPKEDRCQCCPSQFTQVVAQPKTTYTQGDHPIRSLKKR
ncbi:unnamed protein product [Didymodactylos carnosus]|uniref:Uncharacterized protein n=1 Tax=Didymodactylos carnosus TaxID=1234261 RepID=A0A8S2KD31_9BILA|nr:unnamed protein product [Didymodactylos carnosus]CAF3847678.1 unnamed protein product [Didymodactylos carnosus]